MPRKRILICDDQQKFIDAFKQAHKNHYIIEEEPDIRKLAERIEGGEPDLILLDLYHPKDDKNDFVERLQEAESQLENLDKQIENTKRAVKSAWDTLGIKALKDIREKYEDIPVVIFSQTGPILLDDEEIKSVVTNDGYFMLKKEHNMRNMSMELNSIMENKSKLQKLRQEIVKYESVQKKYRIFTITSWFIFPLFFLFILIVRFNFNTLENIAIGVFSSLLATVVAVFVSRIFEK